MRRAKDNRQVSKRYYRPEQTTCQHCGQVLKRCYPLWRKYIVFLSGRYLVVSMGYHCPNPQCAGHHRVAAAQAARRLTLRGSSFALEVVVQIGYLRFWHRWTVAQIHDRLTQEHHLPISRRQVLNLIGVFLVLLRCTYHLRLQQHAAYFRWHGLFVAIDALKPEKGNTALYVVRELKFGLVLHEVALLTADHKTLEQRLLQPVRDLGYHLRGLISDDEKALVIAVARTFPGVPHQTCQSHCLREAAIPIANADRAFKKALKKAIRGPFYAACRVLQEQLASADPRAEVLHTYAELMRSTLTEASKPPFALGGLSVFEDLARLEASLKRSRQKGAIPSWINYWRWSNCADRLRPSIGNSSAGGAGWWNWTAVSTRRKTSATHARLAGGLSAKSQSSWLSCNSTRKTTGNRPRWSPISAPHLTNAGRGSSSVMRGPNAIARTMIWKPSLAGCGPGNVKFMVASPSMSLSSAMANGRSSSTRRNPTNKSCIAVSSLTKPSLIESRHAFSKCSTGFKCSIVFATGLVAV
ncbi:MAG: transposase [Acidobacteria bacterium]|nr:transposase [Acidobacteriota bacterium]